MNFDRRRMLLGVKEEAVYNDLNATENGVNIM